MSIGLPYRDACSSLIFLYSFLRRSIIILSMSGEEFRVHLAEYSGEMDAGRHDDEQVSGIVQILVYGADAEQVGNEWDGGNDSGQPAYEFPVFLHG